MKRVRHELRYPVGLPASIGTAQATLDVVTRDVSFEGVSVETPGDGAHARFKLGQLVQLKISLPHDSYPIEVSAAVAHRALRKRSLIAGLRFFGMGGAARAKWDEFVSRLRDEFPPMTGRAMRALRGEHFEPMLYRSEHQVAVLRVYAGSVSELYALLDPGRDGLFVVTDEPVKVGDELGLQFAHPDSEDIFEIGVFVTRIVDQHGVRGLEVEFLDFLEERRDRFKEFIDDGLEAIFDEESVHEDSNES